ncbi:hypothetical protein B296_00054370 [Ensete ventricosum]|uniref:Uncharacterized protein n=1 Tax=Ensete ventricosum TaxID=4639 RepID=A0A426Y471_ENSVE|nr:hypothetical protein B296_00054370 [Ensete ventricosum]
MSQSGEVTRVRKIVSMVWRCDSAILTSGRFLRKMSARPPAKRPGSSCLRSAEPLRRSIPDTLSVTYCQGCCRLVSPSHSLCHVASRPCQGRCRRVSPLRPLCHGANHAAAMSGARDHVCCRSIGTSDLPAIFAEAGSTPNVRPTWRHCDVTERHNRGAGVVS